MALFKIFRGPEDNLNSVPLHEGYAYFTEDKGNLFIDISNEEGGRLQVNAYAAQVLKNDTTEIDIDDIFKWNHIPIYKGRFRNDSCRNAVITNKRYFIHIIWILHCVFIIIPCTRKRIGGIYFGSLPTRYLLCTSYFDIAYVLGDKRYSLYNRLQMYFLRLLQYLWHYIYTEN